MKETSKATIRRQHNWAFVHRYFVGCGLDVGSGDDPLNAADWTNVTMVTLFDRPDGESETLPFADQAFDFVHASNVLEHFADPAAALTEWKRVCKPGGHVILTVPDFDLYEQGVWPSPWNAGHRWRFNIITVYELARAINLIIKKIELIDTRYDYALRGVDQTFDANGAEAFIEGIFQKQ